ncbi:unnamed protein product [Pleuronectes platessa]|uniref:Uncharacterized protein n=1 Tax=Pleuronectes platessa TaxID=8262 RepID=A0A9N7VF55_PLEPL|nr:unnamed protein product [Pleuronectes platessa]
MAARRGVSLVPAQHYFERDQGRRTNNNRAEQCRGRRTESLCLSPPPLSPGIRACDAVARSSPSSTSFHSSVLFYLSEQRSAAFTEHVCSVNDEHQRRVSNDSAESAESAKRAESRERRARRGESAERGERRSAERGEERAQSTESRERRAQRAQSAQKAQRAHSAESAERT